MFAKYKNTFAAFCELINNSLQAGSKTINITSKESKDSLLSKKIDYIQISDNGIGVSQSDFKKKIFEIGTDAKIGGQGIGRFAAFQIGDALTIETVAYDQILKNHTKTVLSLTSSMFKGEAIEDKKIKTAHTLLEEKSETGYTVKISDIYSNEIAKKEKHKKTHKNLFQEFIAEALFLQYPLEILQDKIAFIINGKAINKNDYIIGDVAVRDELFVDTEGNEFNTKLSFIRYKSTENTVKIFLRVDNSNIKTVAYSFDYKCELPEADSWLVYVDSELFDNNKDIFRNLMLSEIDPNVKHLITSIKGFVDGYFKETFKEYFDFSKKLKSDVYYPYRQHTASSTSKSIVFNQLAYFIEQEHRLLSLKSDIRKVVYPLIDKAISHGELTSIIEEILTLKDDGISKFKSLINKSKLEEIIHFTDEVGRKSQFLDVLNDIVYGEPAKLIKERSQLHKIIEKQLWLFGEQYNHSPTLFSDKNLENNLTKLRQKWFDYELTKDDENLVEIDDEKIRDITDLFFFNERILDNDEREVMIVELKRPSCRIGQKELAQLDRYRFDIEETGAYPQNVVFKILLISSDYTRFAKSQIGTEDLTKPFLYKRSKTKNIETYVMLWSDLIHNNKKKLSYMGNVLKTEDVDAKELLQKEYPNLNLSDIFSSIS
jgi:uncharacterized protein (UPF0335 family)